MQLRRQQRKSLDKSRMNAIAGGQLGVKNAVNHIMDVEGAIDYINMRLVTHESGNIH